MSSQLPATKQFSSLNLRLQAPTRSGVGPAKWFFLCHLCLGFFLVLLSPAAALPQQDTPAAQPITSEIVQRLVANNAQRSRELGAYTSRRHYHVAYLGFPHSAEADMIVDAVCSGANSKQFDVVSESGSRLLLDHVLKRLLKTEQEDASHRTNSALTPANYTFSLVGTEQDEGRLLYVLRVEPILPGALLYHGKIWVDAQDYAVVKIEAEPAKSPSFWIRNTEINRQYEKTGDFWLPSNDRSETKVRLGGTAVLTIEYKDYRFAAAAVPHGSTGQVEALR